MDAVPVPLEPTETVYTESAVVAEFRNKTTESFHLINDKTEFDIELEVEEQLRVAMEENDIAGEIKGVVLYGSRSRGLETSEETDIDIVVQIDGAELKEDALFNIFSDMNIEIDGIPVDVNPIRPEETGTLETYLPKAEAYLEQKQAEKAEQVFSSSDGKQEQVGLEVPDEQEALIEEAKKRINDFVAAEYYSEGADFSDLSNIEVVFTETEDGKHDIQASYAQQETPTLQERDTYKIYQMKSGDEYHYKRFEGFEKQPEPVSVSDYDLVYEGSLADINGDSINEKLEAVFDKFNIAHPDDFTGHSLSVSDFVVIEQDGQTQAHFVDSFGFKDVPDFFIERTQKAEQTTEQPKQEEEPPSKIRASEIKIGDRFEYKGKEYEVTSMKGVYPDDVGVSYIDKLSNGREYVVTSNISRYKLANEGEYLGNTQSEPEQEQAENYQITDLMLGQKKPLDKFNDNLAAIRTLKQLEAEDRQATPEEQEILSKYTGWGGLAKAFEPENKHYPEVRELLTDDEFEAARKSTMTAFYTSPVIIKEMYSKLADMGFDGGKLLEPSCGIGNFIGMIPSDNTKVTGVELDSLTGRIAQKLYPQAQIQVCGFENSKLKENSFDVAVGNVPFGDIHLFDKKYNPNNLLIHDYFFLNP